MFGAFYVEKEEKYHIIWNATLFGNLQIDFHLGDKKKVEMMDVLTSVVLSHFHIVSMFLSVLKINLAPFCKRRL